MEFPWFQTSRLVRYYHPEWRQVQKKTSKHPHSIGSPSNGWNHHHNFIDKCLRLLSRNVSWAMLIRLCFLSFIVFSMFFFLICWDIPLAAMPNKKLLMLRVGPGPLLNFYLSPITRHWSLRYLCVYIYISLIIVVGRLHHKSAVYWIIPAPNQQNPSIFPLSECFCFMVGQRQISESSTP